MPDMRFYMAYSRNDGPHEGAILVAAHSLKKAKRLAWAVAPMDFMDYTDLAVKWIKGQEKIYPLINKELFLSGVPHVITNPTSCISCNHWGEGVDLDGNCGWCGEHPGEELTNLLSKRGER